MKCLFRIVNPLVSPSFSVQRQYRQALMRQFARTEWVSVAQAAAKGIEPYLQRQRYSDGTVRLEVALQGASQSACLAALLQSLFGIDQVDHSTMAYIASEVHVLMVGLKVQAIARSDPQNLPLPLRSRSDKLITVLRELFASKASSSYLVQTLLTPSESDADGEDISNPLSLVIPAYEALWRGVFYTILAVLQQPPSNCQDVLTLRNSNPASMPSNAALAIANESLRLYPPLRRIRRDYQVDVERIHRDERIWGPSALDFCSSRFLQSDTGEKITTPPAFLPFAAGSMKCPSSYGFSTRMIVTVVGEMLRQFFPEGAQPTWEMEGEEWDEKAQKGEVLRSGRTEYERVKIVVVSRD